MKMQKYFLFFVLMASQNFLPSEEADLRISSLDIFEKVKNNLDLITKELKDLRGKTTETTTAAPTTAAPTTAAPTTAAPTTAAPTTAAPTTAAPTTAAPTTAPPTTAAPTTPAPTTAGPTTAAPTTGTPTVATTTSAAPTTPAPTSAPTDDPSDDPTDATTTDAPTTDAPTTISEETLDYEENDYSDEKTNTEEEDLETEIKNAETTSKTTTKVTTTTLSKNSIDANPPKNSIEMSRTNKNWMSLRTVVKTFISQTNNLPEDPTAEDIKKVVATTNEVLKSINLYELTQKDVNDTDVVKSQLKWANTFLDDHPDIRTELKEDEEFLNDVSAAEEAAVNKQEEAEDVEVLFGVGLGSPFFAIYISLIVASFLLIMAILVQLLMICNKKRAPSQVSEVPLQVIQDPEPQKEFGIRQRQLSQEEALVEELTVVSHQRIPRTPQTEVPYKPVVPRRVIPRQYSGSYQGESRIPAARESQQYRRNRNA